MKRFGRILWRVCVTLSLMSCIAVIILWVRSYFICDCLWWSDVDRVDPSSSNSTIYNVDRRLAGTKRGLEVSYSNGTSTILNGGRGSRHEITWQQVDRSVYPLFFNPTWKTGIDLRAAGLRIAGGHESGRNFAVIYNTHGWIVIVPHWMAFVASIVLPGIAVLRRTSARQDARRAAGLCANCGYDLRGSSSQCPECGKPSLALRDAHEVNGRAGASRSARAEGPNL